MELIYIFIDILSVFIKLFLGAILIVLFVLALINYPLIVIAILLFGAAFSTS